MDREDIRIGGGFRAHEILSARKLLLQQPVVNIAEFLGWENMVSQPQVVAFMVDEVIWQHSLEARPAVLNVCDHVHLDQRVTRNSARRGDGGADRRILAEAALKYFVHGLPVLDVVQEDAAFQYFFHGRSGILQSLLNLFQHVGGVGLDIAGKMRADAGYEKQIAVGNRAAEQRRRFRFLASVMDLFLGSGLGLSRAARERS